MAKNTPNVTGNVQNPNYLDILSYQEVRSNEEDVVVTIKSDNFKESELVVERFSNDEIIFIERVQDRIKNKLLQLSE